MKLNKEQFKHFILNEVKKIAVQEGWVNKDVQAENEQNSVELKPGEKESVINGILNKKGVSVDRRTLEQLSDTDLISIDGEQADYASSSMREEKAPLTQKAEPVNESTEEPKIEITEVKMLAEEFTRMKELVDFRSPLLRKDS